MFSDKDRYVLELENKCERLMKENSSLVYKLKESERQIEILQKEGSIKNTSPDNSINRKHSGYKTYNEVMDEVNSNKNPRKSAIKANARNESIHYNEGFNEAKTNLMEADMIINNYNTVRSQQPASSYPPKATNKVNTLLIFLG